MAGRAIEIEGRTVDDAVQQALRELGLTRDEVEIQVLDEGRGGVLGVGQTPALVRVVPLGDDQDLDEDYEDSDELDTEGDEEGDEESEAQPDYRGRASRGGQGGSPRGGGRPVMEREGYEGRGRSGRRGQRDGGRGRGWQDRGRGRDREPRQSEPRAPLPPFELAADPDFEPDEDPRAFAIEVVRDLTRLMGFDVNIADREPETPMDGLDHSIAVIDITAKPGDDLGLLIGRHGSHITALQYVVNVIISRAIDGDHPVSIDVDGYRRRREEALHDIAERAAAEVREYGGEVVLASMPPAERRIIHLALMDEPDLETASEGDGPQRRVKVSLRE